MILVSKFIVHRVLSDKTYLSLGLLSPLIKRMDKYEKSNEYNQEIPQSLTAGQPTTPSGRATEHQKSQVIYGEV